MGGKAEARAAVPVLVGRKPFHSPLRLLNGEKMSSISRVESEKWHLHSYYGVRGIFRMRPDQIWGEGSQGNKGLEGRVGGTDKSH